MDPQATWDMLLQAWSKRNWEEVSELSESLLGWLAKGGFPPETNYPKELGADWDSSVALAACGFALCRSRQVLDNEHGIPADVRFSLVCAKCLDEGPLSFDEATQMGWSRIEYYPAGKGENFLGICSVCRASD
ncbi:MAG: hypothetical protein IT422_26275 [Pirellulaceae bacterium]|nr:hypothetical protein [Pirellulaceae bacterium]